MIEIEERSSEEILKISGKIVSIASKVVNPAFDVTPNKLISGIITEKGIIMNPNKKKIIKFKDY